MVARDVAHQAEAKADAALRFAGAGNAVTAAFGILGFVRLAANENIDSKL